MHNTINLLGKDKIDDMNVFSINPMIGFPPMDLQWTTAGVLSALYCVVAILLIVVLWNVAFIVINLRKIVRNVEYVSKEVQDVILKPIAMADQILAWISDHLASRQKKQNSESKNGFVGKKV